MSVGKVTAHDGQASTYSLSSGALLGLYQRALCAETKPGCAHWPVSAVQILSPRPEARRTHAQATWPVRAQCRPPAAERSWQGKTGAFGAAA